MSLAVSVLNSFGNDRWNADVYDIMALASRLSSLVKDRSKTINIVYRLFSLNSKLNELFKELYARLEGRIRDDGSITPEQVQDAIHSLLKLHGLLEILFEVGRRSRLTNNSLTAGLLNSIHVYSEEMLELAQVVELARDKNHLNAIYERASKEREHGDVFDVSQVEVK
ncbi:MAG: hypothetical protein ABSA59_06915 [Terriglobia bacterium]